MSVTAGSTCAPSAFLGPPIETSFAFTNFSAQFFATLSIREHGETNSEFYQTPLLPPGAAHRVRFLDSIGVACPEAIDLQIRLYDSADNPDAQPIAAGEVQDIPACSVQVLETYTVVNWDAPAGTVRVKLAQDTLVDEAIRDSGRFADDADHAWTVEGVDSSLETIPLPDVADPVDISGAVILADGTPLDGIGVLIRSRFRVRLDDGDPANDPDADFSEPIDFAVTDANGSFTFERPAGAYQIECFSDNFAFRPGNIFLETPSDQIVFIAEVIMP
jgi:hypothetical protein